MGANHVMGTDPMIHNLGKTFNKFTHKYLILI